MHDEIKLAIAFLISIMPVNIVEIIKYLFKMRKEEL